jgi:hypothetical protein
VCCTLPCAEPFQVRLTSVPRNEQLWKDLQTLSLVSLRPRLPDGSLRQTENIQQTTDNGATGIRSCHAGTSAPACTGYSQGTPGPLSALIQPRRIRVAAGLCLCTARSAGLDHISRALPAQLPLRTSVRPACQLTRYASHIRRRRLGSRSSKPTKSVGTFACSDRASSSAQAMYAQPPYRRACVRACVQACGRECVNSDRRRRGFAL